MSERKCHCLYFVRLFSLLALLQGTANAYLTVSMAKCSSNLSPFRLNEPDTSGAIVFNISGSVAAPFHEPCSATVLVNPGHVMSLYITKPATGFNPSRDEPPVRCPLKLFSVQHALIMEKDLCSPQLEYVTELIISHKVLLVWNPPPIEWSHHLRAMEIVVSAIGRGTRLCSSHSYHWCQKLLRKDILCVTNELMCDGYQNCPDGGDDHPALCFLRRTKTFPQAEGPWESSEQESAYMTIQKFLSVIRRPRPVDLSASTAQPEDLSMNGDDVPDSIPEILAYYSPWGYLMLGMLITGTVLLLCGLWECCCRKPRSPNVVSTGAASSALFIINSDLEVSPPPLTPDPPAYEDLDQPPTYDTLFPITKLTTVEQVVT